VSNSSTKGSTAHGVVGTFNTTGGAVSITTGDVSTEGFAAIGVVGFAAPGSALTIDTTAGTLSTKGINAHGINAVTGSFPSFSSSGTLTIDAGDITTEGSAACGVFASANGGAIDIDAKGDIWRRRRAQTFAWDAVRDPRSSQPIAARAAARRRDVRTAARLGYHAGGAGGRGGAEGLRRACRNLDEHGEIPSQVGL
jgi:hypothetical protein